jgi:hypothetical protein
MYTRSNAECNDILHVKLPKKLKTMLKKTSAKLDISASEIVRRSLAKFIAEAKNADHH